MDIIFWVLLVAVVVYEVVALVSKRRGDTISEKVWGFREWASPAGRIIVDTLLIWLVWHLIIDPTFFEADASWVDLIVVAAAALVSWKWLGNEEA